MFRFQSKVRILILLSKEMIDQRDDQYEIKKTNQMGRGRGSFISKLSEIMKIYPEVIHWTDDGSQIKIEDVQRMEKQIIPTYYRHSNIHSFVRQLNMYYFSKLETTDKNQMLFKNQNFKKGNEDNFYLIQRRNKGRDELITKMEEKFKVPLQRIKEHEYLSNQAKDLMTASIQFQQIAMKNLERIKNNISALSSHMKNSRSKEIKQSIEKLKSTYSKRIAQIIDVGKKIEEFIKNSLCVDVPIEKIYNPSIFSFNEKPNEKQIISIGVVPPSELSIMKEKKPSPNEEERDSVSFGRDGFDEDFDDQNHGFPEDQDDQELDNDY